MSSSALVSMPAWSMQAIKILFLASTHPAAAAMSASWAASSPWRVRIKAYQSPQAACMAASSSARSRAVSRLPMITCSGLTSWENRAEAAFHCSLPVAKSTSTASMEV